MAPSPVKQIQWLTSLYLVESKVEQVNPDSWLLVQKLMILFSSFLVSCVCVVLVLSQQTTPTFKFLCFFMIKTKEKPMWKLEKNLSKQEEGFGKWFSPVDSLSLRSSKDTRYP